MNILEITTFLKGGSGSFVTELSIGFKRKGHNVDVISSGKLEGMSDWEELVNRLQFEGINCYNLNFFKREGHIFWEEVQKLSNHLNTNKYDIIHVQAGVPAFAANVARNISGLRIPIVSTFHSWSPTRPVWMNIADAWSFNQCDIVCFVSNAYEQIGKRYGIKAETKVIYPGLCINPHNYINNKELLREKIRTRHGLHKEAKIIIQVAEISERKGQLDLIKALNLLNQNDVYLFIVGNNKDYNGYYKLLLNEIKKLSLEQQVVFTGWIEDPYEYVASSDLFVFPSYNEGLGLAILESVILQVPTIFSNIEGTNDISNILGDLHCGTFSPGDVTAIAKLIEDKLFEEVNPEKLIKASKLIKETFSYDKTINDYEFLFKQLLDK